MLSTPVKKSPKVELHLLPQFQFPLRSLNWMPQLRFICASPIYVVIAIISLSRSVTTTCNQSKVEQQTYDEIFIFIYEIFKDDFVFNTSRENITR